LKNYYAYYRAPLEFSTGLKPLVDPGGRCASKNRNTAVPEAEVKRPLRNRFRIEAVINLLYNYNGYCVLCNGRSPTDKKCPFGCSGYVTAVAVGQRQRLYFGLRMFTGYYLRFF
jgi:hypothetical protein